jgi:hypothetical protein
MVQAIAHYLDRFENERKSGLWRVKEGGFKGYVDAIGQEFRSKIAPLWDEFLEGMRSDWPAKYRKKAPPQ